MEKLKFTQNELDNFTQGEKQIACELGFKWNPLGNPEVFNDIREDIFNYFLKRKHGLCDIQIKQIEQLLNKSNEKRIIVEHEKEVLEILIKLGNGDLEVEEAYPLIEPHIK